MDKSAQLTAMDKILRELEDLKHSETAVLKKIAQIEAENMNLGVSVLELALPDIHEQVNTSIEQVTEVISRFTEHRHQFAKDHKLEAPEDPSAAA